MESSNNFLYISKSFLSTVRGAELFQFNFDYNLLDLIDRLPEFHKQIIHHRQEIVSTTPRRKTELLFQKIWKIYYTCRFGTELE